MKTDHSDYELSNIFGDATICIRCAYYRSLPTACCHSKLITKDYVFGIIRFTDCCDVNKSGNCAQFEEKPHED